MIQAYSWFDVYRRSIKFEEPEDDVALSDLESHVSKDGVENGSSSRDALLDSGAQKASAVLAYVTFDELECCLVDWRLSVLPTWRKRTLSCK